MPSLFSVTKMQAHSSSADVWEYYHGFDEGGKHNPGYVELIASLQERYPLGQPIVGEESEGIHPSVWSYSTRTKYPYRFWWLWR